MTRSFHRCVWNLQTVDCSRLHNIVKFERNKLAEKLTHVSRVQGLLGSNPISDSDRHRPRVFCRNFIQTCAPWWGPENTKARFWLCPEHRLRVGTRSLPLTLVRGGAVLRPGHLQEREYFCPKISYGGRAMAVKIDLFDPSWLRKPNGSELSRRYLFLTG